ncbi:phage holin family protein [Chitinilyticum piscinae]|uniref:Phage holin family protein n=1 Tax=Chitinilyticum piscinae TaxID=2866724 RepID=A0A8J7FHA5_9NEIS|nr:phage holin family protein [Chitinilyticum piscinae]MBE9607727.1 phage holin family protein [Chitinilyticum piscinae]
MRHPLKQFVGHAVGLSGVIAELFSIEVQEAVERWLGHLIWLCILTVFAGLACLLLSVLLLILFWDTYRIATALSLLLFYLFAAAFAGWQLRKRFLAAPTLFAATIEELRQTRGLLVREDGEDA